MAGDTLVDRWIAKAKNHPGVAAVCVLAIALGGLASFTDSLGKLKLFFDGDAPKPQPPIVVQLPEPKAPPAKRVNFREEFELSERDTFVSNHGVTVATKFIMVLEGDGLVAELGASAKGPVEWVERVRKGKQIELSRSDCDALAVVVRDIQFNWPKEVTMDQLRKMGPAAEGLVTRKVIGTVSGKCEE
jgi:hypothetical protein